MSEDLSSAHDLFEIARVQLKGAEEHLRAAQRQHSDATADYAYARRRLAMSVECPSHQVKAGVDCSGKPIQASGMPPHCCADRVGQAIEQARRRS